MDHAMKLKASSFDKIKDGRKTLELRLFDEKRRAIRLGDRIEFRKEPELRERVLVEVVGLLNYPSSEALLGDVSVSLLGHTEKQAALDRVYSIYTKEEELKSGVLGIKIRVL